MILTKGYNVAFTVKQFNTVSSTPVVFQVSGTGDTRIYTQSTLTPFSIETGTGTVFRVTGNRRVGIGTGSPNCGLEIEPEQNINGVCVKVNHTQPYGFGFRFEGQNSHNKTKAFSVFHSGSDRFIVFADGQTIIGDKKVVGTHSDALLQVSGKVASRSFYVLNPTNWADDFFYKNHDVDIEKIEKFINEFHHLPEVPSENEIKEKGYDVNEMDSILLRKIEELYLILIKQNNILKSMLKCIKE
jgi:hypothetical protein